MVQEALTNIARHAQASKVKIRMRHDGDMLVLVVQDDGIGFTEQALAREGSHGLAGMHERADMLGGKLEINNTRAGGGRVIVSISTSPAPPRTNTLYSGGPDADARAPALTPAEPEP